MAGRSRVNREVHARFCEGLGVKFPWATRLATLGRVVIFFNITDFVEPYYLQKGEKYEDIQIEL
jgi:phage shock protein PspC (stress-responsive transcriptional regulator)